MITPKNAHVTPHLVTDYILYAVLYILVITLITNNLYFLILFIFFTHCPSPLPSGNHQWMKKMWYCAYI